VTGGINIYTGGTDFNPIINLEDDISLNSVSASTFSGGTFYGDGSNLDGIVVSDISYVIWAEDNGLLANASREWSFGNGAEGVNNIYIMYDSTITKMFIDSETEGTTATINLMVNNVSVATGSFSANGVYTFPSAINVSEGDAVGFETNTVVGTWSDVRTGVAVVNTVSGLKGDKGDTGNIEASNDFYVTGTTYSDTYSGNTTEAIYYGDGSNLTGLASPVFGAEFQFAESLTLSTTTSLTYVNKLTLTTTSLPSGDYMVIWSADGGGLDNDTFNGRVQENNTTDLTEVAYRVNSANVVYYISFAGHAVRTLSGVNTFDMDYFHRQGQANIKNARITLYRIL